MAIEVAKGIKDRIKGDVSGFTEPQWHGWKVAPAVLRELKDSKAYQPMLSRVSFIHMGLESPRITSVR